MAKTAKSPVKITDKELEFLKNSNAQDVGEFSAQYVKAFGYPKVYTRPMTIYYGRKQYIAKYDAKIQKKLKDRVTDAVRKSNEQMPAKKGSDRADPIPDEGEMLVKIYNCLKRIEAIVGDAEKVQKDTYELFKRLDKKEKPEVPGQEPKSEQVQNIDQSR